MFGILDFRCLGFHLQVEYSHDKVRGEKPAMKVKLQLSRYLKSSLATASQNRMILDATKSCWVSLVSKMGPFQGVLFESVNICILPCYNILKQDDDIGCDRIMWGFPSFNTSRLSYHSLDGCSDAWDYIFILSMQCSMSIVISRGMSHRSLS